MAFDHFGGRGRVFSESYDQFVREKCVVKTLMHYINTTGGHIIVLLFLVCLGVACMIYHQDEAGKLILVGALATLWPLMSNRKNNDGPK